MGKLLSVIIPVYNVEPYIRECVDSIINQTYKNLEIVLVDDGSPDNCGAICDEYAAKDSRVKVIHQKNQRLGAARNNGRKIATGDYITFVDSDDWLHLETVKWCMDAIEEYELDVIYFGSFRSGKGGDGTGKVTMSDPRAIWEWCTKYEGSLAWGCIIRKEMWEGIYFAEGRAFEEENISD